MTGIARLFLYAKRLLYIDKVELATQGDFTNSGVVILRLSIEKIGFSIGFFIVEGIIYIIFKNGKYVLKNIHNRCKITP